METCLLSPFTYPIMFCLPLRVYGYLCYTSVYNPIPRYLSCCPNCFSFTLRELFRQLRCPQHAPPLRALLLPGAPPRQDAGSPWGGGDVLAAHGAAVFPRPLGGHSADRHAREPRYAALHLFCSPPSTVRTPAPTAHQRFSYLFKLVHKGILMGKYHWQMLWRLGSGARPFPTSSQTQAHAGGCGAGVMPAPGGRLGTGSVCLLLAISGGTASVDMDGR